MTSRCHKCNKKSHILLSCQCGNAFCLLHRNSVDHGCQNTNNVQEKQKNNLLKTLCQITKPKLDLI